MNSKCLSRRNFLKLSGLIAGSTAIALTPHKAFGWLAFEFAQKSPIWEVFGFNDPIHEDSAQFAYSIVLQRHKNDMILGKGPKSLLNPGYKFYSKKDYTINQYFLENFKMLRYGAHWNDAAAFDLLDFLPSVINKNDILEWQSKKTPYYDNLMDIAEHLGQNQNRDYNAFIQFNSNGKLDCLHGMLNSYANVGENINHVSQAFNKELIMQWFEAAYKFAINGEKYPDTFIRYFFDTNNQYSPDLDIKMIIDDSACFIDTDDTNYNTRQLRLRVMGMICHTIQDLWNPAHTIRSYYKDKNDVDRFGKILAFGNYSKQNKGLGANTHKPYDLCSTVDPEWDGKPLRDILIEDITPHEGAPQRIPVNKENFLQNILNWNGSKHSKNISIEAACHKFNTLSLKYTIKYLSDFLEIAYLGLKWTGQAFYYNKNVEYEGNPVSINAIDGFTRFGSVEEWFDGFVLKSMFDIYGNSFICDSGIKTTLSEYEILPDVENLSDVIKTHFGDNGKILIQLLTDLVDIHENYTKLAKDFYVDYNFNGSDYLQDTPECKAKTAQDNLFESLNSVLLTNNCSFKKLVLPDIKAFLENLEIDQYASWNNIVKLICGFLQELYLEIDKSHTINDEIIKLGSQLQGKDTKISFTGVVENVWEYKGQVFIQLRNEDTGIVSFNCSKKQIDNYKYLLIGAKNVTVNCDFALSIYESGVFLFYVDSVKVPVIGLDYIPNYFIRAKIENIGEKTFSATVHDFTKEGKSTYMFQYDKNSLNLEKKSDYLLSYIAIDHKLICNSAKKYDVKIKNIIRHSSQVVCAYSNCLEYLVKTPLPKDVKISEELLESDLLYYDDTQVCGVLQKGEKFDFICIGNNLSSKINNDNIAYGYKKAIRIKSNNYNKDNSMNFYIPSDFDKHIKTDKKLSCSAIEECTFKDGKCIYCGKLQDVISQSTTPDTSDKNGNFIAAATGAVALGASGIVYDNSKKQSKHH